jgi:hypothetical protein
MARIKCLIDIENLGNNKVMKPFILSTLLLVSIALSGQKSVFMWQDGLCAYESKYNSRIYTEKQLRNCLEMINGSYFTIDHIPSVFRPIDIEELILDTLDNEFNKKVRKLKNLDLPNSTYWKELQSCILTELEQVYSLSRIAYLGYKDPRNLKQWNYQDPCLKKHSDALINGGDSLLKDWFELTTEHVKINSNPEKVWQTYHNQRSSKDSLDYAKVDVTTFGWWNCANKYIQRCQTHDTKEFLKLFVKTKIINCDEP